MSHSFPRVTPPVPPVEGGEAWEQQVPAGGQPCVRLLVAAVPRPLPG